VGSELDRLSRRGLGFWAVTLGVAVASLIYAGASIVVAEMLHSVHVEADVYSGRPNPAWELSEADATRFGAWIKSLAAVSPEAGDSAAAALGYRGLVVTERFGQRLNRLRISHGVVSSELGPSDVRHWSDSGRRLEHWLLESGRETLGEELLNYLMQAADWRK